MTPGARVELLVGVNGSARWFPGRVVRVCRVAQPFAGDSPERFDVHTDDGRMFIGCHVDSLRAVVAEAQS